MKNLSTFLVIVLISIVGVAGCAAPATQLPATQPPAAQPPPTQPPVSQAAPQLKSNSEIVLSMIERLNSGDVEGSLAYFADDARAYLMGFPPTGIEIYKGKDQIRSLWEDSVNNHFKWEAKVVSTSGDIVNTQAKTWHDFTRQLGVAPLEYADVYEVVDGKIVTYGSWLTEDSLARFRPAFAEVMPPEPTATPSSDPPGSEMTITIMDGSCNTDSPINLKAGEIKVNLDVKDQDNSMYALTMFNLDAGKDLLDLMVSTAGMPPTWGKMVLFEELGPGKGESYTFTLDKGTVYLICWSKPPDLPIGNAGPFSVVP